MHGICQSQTVPRRCLTLNMLRTFRIATAYVLLFHCLWRLMQFPRNFTGHSRLSSRFQSLPISLHFASSFSIDFSVLTITILFTFFFVAAFAILMFSQTEFTL